MESPQAASEDMLKNPCVDLAAERTAVASVLPSASLAKALVRAQTSLTGCPIRADTTYRQKSGRRS